MVEYGGKRDKQKKKREGKISASLTVLSKTYKKGSETSSCINTVWYFVSQKVRAQ